MTKSSALDSDPSVERRETEAQGSGMIKEWERLCTPSWTSAVTSEAVCFGFMEPLKEFNKKKKMVYFAMDYTGLVFLLLCSIYYFLQYLEVEYQRCC